MQDIVYGISESPFGDMVLAKTDKGLCWLGFMTRGYKGDGLSRMKKHFPRSRFSRNDDSVKPIVAKVLKAWEEDRLSDIALDLQGTDFQRAVWDALLKIPKGKVLRYGDIANDIAKPKAVRAVGTAVGSNPVSLIVPCHRVVPASGGVGNYGWGPALKEKILEAEKP